MVELSISTAGLTYLYFSKNHKIHTFLEYTGGKWLSLRWASVELWFNSHLKRAFLANYFLASHEH